MEVVVPVEKEDCEIKVYGKSQGFRGLPVRHGLQRIDMADGQHYFGPTITTAWKPTPEELAALNAGASIYVDLNTATVAPMLVYVGEPEEVLPTVEMPRIPGL